MRKYVTVTLFLLFFTNGFMSHALASPTEGTRFKEGVGWLVLAASEFFAGQAIGYANDRGYQNSYYLASIGRLVCYCRAVVDFLEAIRVIGKSLDGQSKGTQIPKTYPEMQTVIKS